MSASMPVGFQFDEIAQPGASIGLRSILGSAGIWRLPMISTGLVFGLISARRVAVRFAFCRVST